MMQDVKCVVVGDYKVGKTCLLLTYAERTIPTDFLPALIDDLSESVPTVTTEDGTIVKFEMVDTPGIEYMERLRPLNYPKTNVFILCFSLVDHSTFTNIKEKWYASLKYWCPKTPIILVGTRLDLRDNQEKLEALASQTSSSIGPVSTEEGMQMKDSLKNIVGYVECSAVTGHGVQRVFEEAAKAGLTHKLEYGSEEDDTKCCSIL